MIQFSRWVREGGWDGGWQAPLEKACLGRVLLSGCVASPPCLIVHEYPVIDHARRVSPSPGGARSTLVLGTFQGAAGRDGLEAASLRKRRPERHRCVPSDERERRKSKFLHGIAPGLVFFFSSEHGALAAGIDVAAQVVGFACRSASTDEPGWRSGHRVGWFLRLDMREHPKQLVDPGAASQGEGCARAPASDGP